MEITRSFQGTTVKCIKSFSFFKAGKEYYCIYDNGEYFYIWCNHEMFGVNEIKIHSQCKQHFRSA